MTRFYVYILRDPRDLVPFYVGKGSGWRVTRHLRGQAHSIAVRNKIAKLLREGVEPLAEVTYAIDESHAFFLEMRLIEIFGRRDQNRGPLLNLTDGGEGMSGWVPNDETRSKLRVNRNTDARREQLLRAHLGAKRSEETRQKISDRARGRTVSDATRAKLSAARLGKTRPDPEYRARLSASIAAAHAKNPRTHSAETKQKMSASQQARRIREGWKNGV